MILIEFTAPNGQSVFICPAWVQEVRLSTAAEGGATAILLSGEWQFVMEELETVLGDLRHD